MSMDLNGKKCAICDAYLFEEDDVVFCPICGAPHHRDCYDAIGNCGLNDRHGTELQYDIVQKKQEENKEKSDIPFVQISQENIAVTECNKCGTEYDVNMSRCPNCGMPNMEAQGFAVPDMLGGVAKDSDIGEGITAENAKKFVLISTNKIIPEFMKIKNGGKGRFSWWAFLFPTAQFASRKIYPATFLIGVLEIAFWLLNVPLYNQMENLGIKTADDIMAYFGTGTVPGEFMPAFLMAFAGLVGLFILALFCGFNFNKIYYKHVLTKIREIEDSLETEEERMESYSRKGGMNIFGFLLAYVIIQYVPGIIATFIL